MAWKKRAESKWKLPQNEPLTDEQEKLVVTLSVKYGDYRWSMDLQERIAEALREYERVRSTKDPARQAEPSRFTNELCEMLIKRNYVQSVPLTGTQIVMVVEQALKLDADPAQSAPSRELVKPYIIGVIPWRASGAGWANQGVNVIKDDRQGKIFIECLYLKDHPQLHDAWHVSIAAHSILLREVEKLAAQSAPKRHGD